MIIFKIEENKYVAKALCFHSLTTAIDVLKKLYDCKVFNVVNMEERAKAYWLNNWKPKYD